MAILAAPTGHPDHAMVAAAGTAEAAVEHVADRDHVTILRIDGDYGRTLPDGSFNSGPRAAVAREFLAQHADRYDFLIAFTTFEFETGGVRAFYAGLRNDAAGLGIPLFDGSAAFGSAGRLQGYIDMAALGRYVADPMDPRFEDSLVTLTHELLHRWGGRVRFRDRDQALSSRLISDDGHWSFLLDSDASVLYGNDWRDDGDGQFTAVGVKRFYSPLDLYLAGFYRPEEVPPFFVITGSPESPDRLPQVGARITGEAQAVTIEDVIAAEGPRVPAASAAQKSFRVAFLLLTRPDDVVSEAQILALNHLRTALQARFSILTAGRARLEVFPETLDEEAPGGPTPIGGGPPRAGGASIADGLSWLRGRQSSEGYWQDTADTRIRDSAAAVSALVAHDPSFTRAADAGAWLHAQAARSGDERARRAGALDLLAAYQGSTGPDRAALISAQNTDGGWGLAAGYRSDPLDTALALLALQGRPGVATGVLARGGDYLVANQGPDGGWGSVAGAHS